jgi:hypothetical protein
MGCSTSRYDSAATTSAAAAATQPTTTVVPNTACAKTMAGQCQRYQPYDRSPIHPSARADSARVTNDGPPPIPARSRHVVAATGITAAAPGNASAGLSAAIEIASRMTPASDVRVRTPGDGVLSHAHAATSAPARNSQRAPSG